MSEQTIAAMRTTSEIVKLARQRLDQNAWDYLTGGAETETTLLRNRQALDEIAFRPRVLNNVSDIDLSREFLGMKMRLPVFLAPIGGLQQICPNGGGLPALKAAEDFGILSILSSVTEPGMDVAKAEVKSPLGYQLYVHGDDAWVFDILDQVQALGFVAFCLTVDTAIYSRRERDLIKGHTPRGRQRAGLDRDYQAKLDWDQIDRIRDKCKVALVAKGIATAEDARLAVEHGIDIVYISNHGGRQLDHGRGAIAVLPEVVEAVDGKAKVVVDGGFVRGTDIIKAIALGADAVGIGKLYGWGLAAGGQEGVARVLDILEEEMQVSMGLLGANALDKLTPAHLYRDARPVRAPSVTSGFPHIKFPDFDY